MHHIGRIRANGRQFNRFPISTVRFQPSDEIDTWLRLITQPHHGFAGLTAGDRVQV